MYKSIGNYMWAVFCAQMQGKLSRTDNVANAWGETVNNLPTAVSPLQSVDNRYALMLVLDFSQNLVISADYRLFETFTTDVFVQLIVWRISLAVTTRRRAEADSHNIQGWLWVWLSRVWCQQMVQRRWNAMSTITLFQLKLKQLISELLSTMSVIPQRQLSVL